MLTFLEWIIEENYYRNKKGCPYWGDGGSGVLPLARNTGRFLVNHRGADVNEGGTYGIFGGGIFLDETNYENIEQVGMTDYPKQHALKELHEETGYNGTINMIEVFVYKDKKINQKGEQCNFFYWNFVGLTPIEFPVSPNLGHAWEEGGNSKWVSFKELISISPKHFGLESLLQNAGTKIKQMSDQIKTHYQKL